MERTVPPEVAVAYRLTNLDDGVEMKGIEAETIRLALTGKDV
jgi:hypothetical protein